LLKAHSPKLAACDCAEHDQRLTASDDGFGQFQVRRLMGQVLFAGKETQEGAAFFCYVIANGTAEHRVTIFERIEGGPQSYRGWNVKLDLAPHVGEVAEMERKHDANHFAPCSFSFFNLISYF
jgi:hypothetical protein